MDSESNGWAESECNICYGTPDEPVVTLCGHLYCWRCLFTWMNTNRSSIICPVCKAGINQNMIVPIFTKGENRSADTVNEMGLSIPPRPRSIRFNP